MSKDLKFKELLRILERVLEQIPDGRRGPNRRYSLKEAGVAAFAVFFHAVAVVSGLSAPYATAARAE